MEDMCPGKGSSVAQLLHSLRLEITNNILHRPPDMTAKAASEWEDSATRVVADTRYFLNTFNPAVQLPSDILVIIPSFLPADEDIFAISQVCRRWRATFTSFPLLWTRIDCEDLPRTIARLERHRSIPLQLRLNDGFSMEALGAVLDHKAKITSVSTDIRLDQLQSLHSSLVTPFAEEIVLFVRTDDADDTNDMAVDVKGEFPSLRRFGVFGFFVPTAKIVAPNLIHLSLEAIDSYPPESTTMSILNMLQGCPQLETVLIHFLIDEYKIPESHVPIALPKLRSIGLGCGEVCCGLVLPLRFPPTAVVSFLDVSPLQVEPGISFVLESIRFVLAAVDIQSLTLAHTEDEGDEYASLNGICIIRYEGPKGSLEIIDRQGDSLDLVVGPGGLLLSHSPRLDGVKTLHLTDCSIGNDVMISVASAVPNVTSVKFGGHNTFPKFLIPTTGSQPPLPHLKHVTGLPLDESLLEMVTARKEMGVPLDVLDVNDNHLTCCRDLKVVEKLKEHVKEVKTWERTAVPEYRISGVLLDVWKEAGHRVPESLDWLPEWPDPY